MLRHHMDDMISIPAFGRLEVRWPADHRAEAFYMPSSEAITALGLTSESPIVDGVKLLEIDVSKRRFDIFPIKTHLKIETFLKPKYNQIK